MRARETAVSLQAATVASSSGARARVRGLMTVGVRGASGQGRVIKSSYDFVHRDVSGGEWGRQERLPTCADTTAASPDLLARSRHQLELSEMELRDPQRPPVVGRVLEEIEVVA